VERQAAACALPFRKPSQFPRNSVLAARVGCAALDADWLPAYAARGASAPTSSRTATSPIPRWSPRRLRAAGQDPEVAMAAAASPEHKGKLREATDAAWALGIFGAPLLRGRRASCSGGTTAWSRAFGWYRPAARTPATLLSLDAAQRARAAREPGGTG
jgi:2-hydroxychromene-2-carboxylate isomerase